MLRMKAGGPMTTSEQARADAMADAETLCVHSAKLLGGGHSRASAELGRLAEYRAWRRAVEGAVSAAQRAARAAFRARLRG